ncbi:MAG: tetratricopeptide repeat protein [Magnetococcales bacterium]|nr:tetratricopeptide repeat protein [Magnetococcales bacterium]
MDHPLQHYRCVIGFLCVVMAIWLRAAPLWAAGTVDDNLLAGAEALGRENLEQAIEQFTQAIDAGSGTREQTVAAFEGRCAALYKKSLIKNDTDLTKGAIADCSRSLEFKSDHQRSYRLRGTARLTLGDAARALEDLNVAQALNPQDYLTLQNRGLALARSGQPERAIDDFNQAIKIKPTHIWSYYNRGRLYAALGRHERAVDDFSHFIRHRHDYEAAFLYRGRSWLASGAYQQALVDLHESLRLKPEANAEAHYWIGVGLYLLERYDEALADFEEVRQLDDTRVVNALWLYLTRERLGKPGRDAFAGIRNLKEDTHWPGAMVAHMMERGSAETVLVAAAEGEGEGDGQSNEETKNLALFILGELALIKHQPIQENTWFPQLAAKDPGLPWVHAALWRTRDLPKPKSVAGTDSPRKTPVIVDPIITGSEDLDERTGPPTVRPDSPLTSGAPIKSKLALSTTPPQSARAITEKREEPVQEVATITPENKAKRTPHVPGTYAFKLAAYESTEHVDQALAEISRLNLPVYLQDFQIKEHSYLRVWVGPFKTEEQAMAAWKRVKALPGANPSAVRKR